VVGEAALIVYVYTSKCNVRVDISYSPLPPLVSISGRADQRQWQTHHLARLLQERRAGSDLDC
jgi:hypothetical protein